MANKPGWFRNFFGRGFDAITPGVKNYDPNTGQFMHVGNGLLQIGLRGAGIFTGNPLLSTVGPRIAAGYANRADAASAATGQPAHTPYASLSPAPAPVPNLGLGAQAPGNSWQGYMQSAGSANNFGNQQFGSGMASIPGTWGPNSGWGQSVVGGQPSPGSLGGFGNNVPNFLSGNSGAAMTASRTGGSSGPVSSLGMGVRGALLGPRSSLGIEKGRVKV